MVAGTGFREWPTSSGGNDSYIYVTDLNGQNTFCPQHYGATPNILGDERLWFAGTGGQLCSWLLFPSVHAYLPEVKGNYSGWNSTIIIRNNSSSAFNATITFYNTDGTLAGAQPNTAISGNGALTVSVSSVVNSFMGSAIVAASGDVSVIARDQRGDELDEYNGLLASGGSPGWEQVGSTLYAPVIKNAYAGRSSRLLIANAGTAGMTVTAQFYNANGGLAGSAPLYLPVNGSGRIDGSNCTTNLCSAKVWSDNGQPLAVAILERADSDQNSHSIHNAFNTGTTSNFVPVVKNNYGGQTTGVTIQNLGTQNANISLTCYDSLSSAIYACGTQNGVPSMATAVFYLGTAGLPNPFLGSAVVNATQPVASLIYESGNPYKLCTDADLSGSTTAYAPEIYGNYGGQAWNSGITVQNVGSGDATVTVTYYWQDGSQVTPSYSCTIAQNRMCTFSYWSGNMPPNFYGSAIIQATQPIAAVVNTAHTGNGDTKASYTASNR
jgi:hypothetical protein